MRHQSHYNLRFIEKNQKKRKLTLILLQLDRYNQYNLKKTISADALCHC